jgi:hypothetical protein
LVRKLAKVILEFRLVGVRRCDRQLAGTGAFLDGFQFARPFPELYVASVRSTLLLPQAVGTRANASISFRVVGQWVPAHGYAPMRTHSHQVNSGEQPTFPVR